MVLGQDLSLGKTLGFDVIEDANIFAGRDVITHSVADGAIVDWSLIGRPAVIPPTICSHASETTLRSASSRDLMSGAMQCIATMSTTLVLEGLYMLIFWQGLKSVLLIKSGFEGRGGNAGGKISLDKDANAAIYGPDVDPDRILRAPASTHSPPSDLRPLYDAVDEISRRADDDVRKFNGFRKHWNPDTSTLKPKEA